ncbi:MAG: thiamine-phosphate kinase [Betaproteobacteria bacterium]|nr:thiamine-phosphate kinase [Betaproteobacteria bacterium]
MNEFELIRRYFDRPARSAVQGIGDDCARIAPRAGHELAITTDTLVEGRHFLPDADPRKLGHKCLAVNLSDLAAAAATPRWFTLAITFPLVDEAWLDEFAGGLFALAERHGAELVGGDTTRGAVRSITIAALGEVPAGQGIGRGGARSGDDLWISGRLGGASLALVHPELAGPARRLHEPEPRVALGEKLRGLASAAIDVSDGLAGDLGHILERSGVGALVRYADIPKEEAFESLKNEKLERDCVLAGGDDYELLFTAPRQRRDSVRALADVTRIGEIVAERRLLIVDAAGNAVTHKASFDHFA